MAKVLDLEGNPASTILDDRAEIVNELTIQLAEREAFNDRQLKRQQEVLKKHLEKHFPDMVEKKVWEFKDVNDALKATYSRFAVTGVNLSFQVDPQNAGKVAVAFILIAGFAVDTSGRVMKFVDNGIDIQSFVGMMKIADDQDWTPPKYDA